MNNWTSRNWSVLDTCIGVGFAKPAHTDIMFEGNPSWLNLRRGFISFLPLPYKAMFSVFWYAFISAWGYQCHKVDLNKGRILMFKGISKVKLLLPFILQRNFKVFQNKSFEIQRFFKGYVICGL